MATKRLSLSIAGREVSISNPDKIYFPKLGVTKLQLVEYYLAVAEGAVRGVARRPLILKRFPDGVEAEPFYQKRAPEHRPDWIKTAVFTFPSGRHAEEVVVDDPAALAWIVNLGCVDLNPHAVRAEDMDHPDELRIDLDPVPGVPWPQIVEVAQVARAVLEEHGLTVWAKTSGSRGIHLLVRIRPAWPFDEVRRAAVAVAREVERRAPDLATSKWWKEERHGVFLDYNQNARDRTTASAYSVRPTADARVSMPLPWERLVACEPTEFTIATVPALVARDGDAHAGIDDAPGGLDGLLALADAQAAQGLGDAPWPPHFEKHEGEGARVAPSRARGAAGKRPPRPQLPVIVIGQAKTRAEALAGLERWKARHPDVAAKLEPADVLVDTQRGRSSAYYRVRVNLQHVPEEARPAQEDPDPAYDPKVEWEGVEWNEDGTPKKRRAPKAAKAPDREG